MSKKARPILLLTLINIIGFALLYLPPSKAAYNLTFLQAGLILCAINTVVYIVLRFFNFGDEYLFLLTALLINIGIIMLFRLDFASGTPKDYGQKQIIWYLIGLCVFFATYFFVRFVKHLDKLLYFYVGLTFLIFIVTLIFGKEINGAKNWIYFGNYSFQPSEITKIVYVFALSAFVNLKCEDESFLSGKFWGIDKKDVFMTAYVYMCLLFFVLQKELGAAVLFFSIYITVLFLNGSNYKLILINIVLVLLASYIIIFAPIPQLNYAKGRINTWIDPWHDSLGAGFDMSQSLVAIASGGYFGTGLWNGFSSIIDAIRSDFIFSAICEEMGIYIGVAIIMIYFMFSYRGVKIALGTKDDFYKTVAILTTIAFAYQTFIIVGGVIKLIPLTGITLPFVSAGGSSLISSYISMGILVAISGMERRTD